MDRIAITNRDDLRPGDWAVLDYISPDGVAHRFEGEAWSPHPERLLKVSAICLRIDGEWEESFHLVSATRRVKPLPTGPGSVILVTECRGERVDEPVVAVRSADGDWVAPARTFGGCYWHLPEHITAWTEAKVVPA